MAGKRFIGRLSRAFVHQRKLGEKQISSAAQAFDSHCLTVHFVSCHLKQQIAEEEQDDTFEQVHAP
jgi:hypothetical protein